MAERGGSLPAFRKASPIPVVQEKEMTQLLRRFWSDNSGQDVAEYAVMLAVVLTITVFTVRLIGSNSDIVFSQVSSKIG